MTYKPGAENLISVDSVLKNKKIGLLTNPSGVDSNLNSTIDALKSRYNLVKLFAPEHGIRAERQAGESVASYQDDRSGLEVISVYGEKCEKIPEDVECMVYDIQDVGVRHYSYLYLLGRIMKKCADQGLPLVVLDRYNPLGLSKISGNILDDRFSSDVGGYALATQYAMTVGEFAQYINNEYKIGCDLHVAPCIGLERDKDYRHYRPHWVLPSPNIPTFDTALCYVGTVLFEGTNVSEGRGTTKSFEFIGAPWMRHFEVVKFMSAQKLEGVNFMPVCFRPTFSKHAGELCNGVQIFITDYDKFDPYRCGLLLLNAVKNLNPEFEFLSNNSKNGKSYFIDHLAGTDVIRNDDFLPENYIESQKLNLEAFKKKIQTYYIYHHGILQ